MRRMFTKTANSLESVDSGFQHTEEGIILKKKLEEFEECLNILNKKVKDLMLIENIEEEEFERELESADLYHTKWLTLNTRFDDRRDVLTAIGSNQGNQAHAPPKLRLPSLELQSFDGEIKNWMAFWGQFKKIDGDPSIDCTDKYMYLLQAMRPSSDVKRLVESFPSTAYKECLQQLKERFAREDLLIQVYVRELLALVLNKQTNGDIAELHDKLRAHLRALESLGVTNNKYEAFLLPMVESALPHELLKLWERYRNDNMAAKENKINDLEKILLFLKQEVDSEQRIKIAKNTFFKEDLPKEKMTAECLVSSVKQNKTLSCIWCDKDTHSSLECYKANKMSVEARKKHLTDKRACLLCLKIGHTLRQCRNQLKCMVCKMRHSTLICTAKATVKEEKPTGPPTTSVSTAQGDGTVLLQTVMVEIEYEKRKLPVRALFDSGAQRTYIKKEIVEKLKMSTCKEEILSHCLFGKIETKSDKYQVHQFQINSMDNTFKLEVEALSQDHICGIIPVVNTKDVQLNKLLQKHDIALTDKNCNTTEIGLLIGADYLGFLLTGTVLQLKDGLVAIKSKLGWSLQGKQVSTNVNHHVTNILHCTYCDNNLTEYWALESLGIRDPAEVKSKIDATADALTAFNETVGTTEDKRYEVKLPFKTDCEDLLPNYQKAKLRLESMTKKLVHSGKFHDYDKVFNDWESLGIIEKIEADPNIGHYLPHRPVIKESSLTSKIRPVFDASSTDQKGLSLNACLEKGNNMIDIIPNLINNFRTGAIGITSDIEKAFLNISVKPSDREYLKFLWYENESLQDLITYRHCRLVFGLTSSPFLLAATLLYHIGKMKHGILAETAQRLEKSLYVDNCLVSVDTEMEANKFIGEAKAIMEAGQFNLRMWVTSHGLNETGEQTISILGLFWDTTTDELYCNMRNMPLYDNLQNITKRDLLSVTQKVFDPIGYTAPVLLTPKLIIQEAWKRKLDWDKELPSDLLSKFLDWYKHIHHLNDCRIPRRLTTEILKECEVSLHLFCDASKDGCGACVLLRAEKDKKVTVQLIAAKSRVTPSQKLTIPRLELTAALIGSRLLRQVRETLLLQDCLQYCWTDSGVVLYWIKRELPLNTFVGNRVKEIRQNTDIKNWHHIPGESNWADLASRGCNAKVLLDCCWWEGPVWLRSPPADWPRSDLQVDEQGVILETKKSVCSTSTITQGNLLLRIQTYFSKYTKVVRMTAWMLRFIYNSGHVNKKRGGELTYKEYETAEKVIFKLIQNKDEELIQSKSCNLTTLKDEEGLMRVKTKLLLTDFPEGVRTPYLLPGKDTIVKLLVRQRHIQLQHAGANQLIADIRCKCWIIGIRRLVRSVISECVVCTRHRSKPVQAPAAPLPVERTACAAAYQTTGVDLAGPLYLRHGEKCWIVLYTCAVYRSIHLEATRSLSTEAFIMTLRRFIARRGRVDLMLSDQGTNFHGTKNLLNSLDWEEVQRQSTIRRISWKMNAPSAAWWGGFWERLIRILKDLLKRIIGNAILTYDELQTILCDCEATMNSRPLTYISDDGGEYLEPLTPAHFVLPIPNSDVTDLDAIDSSSLNNRLRYVQSIREQFRKRFKTEYLSFLVQKGKEKKDVINVGDIVLIETDEKRLKWPLGVVLELFTGKDGTQRTAKLRTANGLKVRPVQRLYNLEVPGKNVSVDTTTDVTEYVTDDDAAATPPITLDRTEAMAAPEPEALLPDKPQSTRSGRQVKLPNKFKLYM